MNPYFYLFTSFTIFFEIIAQTLFKLIHNNNHNNHNNNHNNHNNNHNNHNHNHNQIIKFYPYFKTYYFYIAIICYTLSGYFAYKMLKYEQLIVVNIIWHIIHFIILFILGIYFFNEKISNKKIVACLFGLISISLFLFDGHNH